jgi:hypothetical protein
VPDPSSDHSRVSAAWLRESNGPTDHRAPCPPLSIAWPCQIVPERDVTADGTSTSRVNMLAGTVAINESA